MNCRNCGAPLDEGAKFCRKCGTEVPETPAAPEKKRAGFAALKTELLHNRKLLYPVAGGVLLLVIALILVISVVSCSQKALKTPEDVADAVVSALQKGDGDRLYALSKTAVPLLGQHPEVFGEGDSPEDVMRTYCRTLADTLKTRLSETYGRDFVLEAQLTAETVTGTAIFEPNRALDVDAAQYAVLTGPLTVSGDPVGTLRLVAAEIGGEWKLLVVYVY